MFSLHINWPADRAELRDLEKRIWFTGYGLGFACCVFGVAAVMVPVTGGPLWALPLFGGLAAIAGTGSHLAWRVSRLAMDRLYATSEEAEQC